MPLFLWETEGQMKMGGEGSKKREQEFFSVDPHASSWFSMLFPQFLGRMHLKKERKTWMKMERGFFLSIYLFVCF